MEAIVRVEGTTTVIHPGDVIDYNQHGVIVWLHGRMAEAYRLERAEHIQKINDTIKFVEARCLSQKLS